MSRTRSCLLRRVVMWGAGVVLVVTVAAWIVSLFGVQWEFAPRRTIADTPWGPAIWFLWGEVQVISLKPQVPGWHVVGLDWPTRNAPNWRNMLSIGAHGPNGRMVVAVKLPLWMPAGAALGALALAWFAGKQHRRWSRAGLCLSCGYDLTGIAGACPECGKEREA